MPFEMAFFDSWVAKAHSCVITVSYFPGAERPHSEPAAPWATGGGGW